MQRGFKINVIPLILSQVTGALVRFFMKFVLLSLRLALDTEYRANFAALLPKNCQMPTLFYAPHVCVCVCVCVCKIGSIDFPLRNLFIL